ncbi:MAG: ribbon-helix-helix domain-containing protein [Pseudomonadota bacterium]
MRTSEDNARPRKRSFTISGHKTSISLEAAFWDALKGFAAVQGRSVSSIVAEIDAGRGNAGLSSAIRVRILQWAQETRPPGSSDDKLR